jgi:apolipoprotein N-acyltransferase
MDPRGETLDRLPVYTEGYMIQDVPLSNTLTPATALGRNLETFVIGFTLSGLVVAMVSHRGRVQRRESAPRT